MMLVCDFQHVGDAAWWWWCVCVLGVEWDGAEDRD